MSHRHVTSLLNLEEEIINNFVIAITIPALPQNY
jgi:hypothetical protein